MGEEKICPINPHGNGYCKRERCAFWVQYEHYEADCVMIQIALGLESIRFELEGIEENTK